MGGLGRVHLIVPVVADGPGPSSGGRSLPRAQFGEWLVERHASAVLPHRDAAKLHLSSGSTQRGAALSRPPGRACSSVDALRRRSSLSVFRPTPLGAATAARCEREHGRERLPTQRTLSFCEPVTRHVAARHGFFMSACRTARQEEGSMLLVLVVLTYVPLLQSDCLMFVTDRDRKNATHHKAGRHFGRPVGPVTGRRKLDGCGGRRDRGWRRWSTLDGRA